MSADGTANQGATTAHGELLTGAGKEYHNGLVCVDGSVIPTTLAVNPVDAVILVTKSTAIGTSTLCTLDSKLQGF
jgi:hypothetical protein